MRVIQHTQNRIRYAQAATIATKGAHHMQELLFELYTIWQTASPLPKFVLTAAFTSPIWLTLYAYLMDRWLDRKEHSK